MTMTEQEFRNEAIYSVTMSHVKTLLQRGLITVEEYRKINENLKAKYHPISDGLVSELALTYPQTRA